MPRAAVAFACFVAGLLAFAAAASARFDDAYGLALGATATSLGLVFWALAGAVFSDAGWSGEGIDAFESAEALVSVGLGISVLDGLVRLDVARGLREPRRTRWDFYLDAAF